jgi:peptide/nickel transport system substrate-binding protein
MKLTKRSAAVLAVAAASTLALTGITPAQAANTTSLTIGSVVVVKSWEPSQADIGHGIQYYQGVYDNLILRAPDGSYKPNLATKWKVSADSKSISLDLRSGVTFTDGSKFDADAAAKNLNAFIAGNGPQAAPFAGGKAAKVDADTVKLTLVNPNPDILYYLATTNSFMASPKALGTAGLKTKPVGSGPYVYDKSSVAGSKVVLTANPKYWDKSKQKFKKITFIFMEQVPTRVNALRSGQIDATILDVANAATATSAGMKLTTYNTDWSGLMLFDRAGEINPALGKLEVRQAIAHAIDRAALLRTVQQGKGKVTGQIFSTASGVYDKALDNKYAYSPTKAKALLATAGYADGFTLQMPYGAFMEPMASFVETYLKAVKIKVDWVTATDYRAEMLSGKYAAAWFQLFQGTPYVNYNLAIAPAAPRNVLKSSDATINAIDSSIKKNASSKNVIAQVKKANKYVVDQAWFVPFYTVPQMYFTNKKVSTKAQAQNAVPYLYSYAPTGK